MAAEIGEALREARIRRGIELGEVERVTKIRIKYRARSRSSGSAPGPAYARGFLSTYAQFLELDDRALVEEYGAGTGWSPRRGRSRRRCCPLVVRRETSEAPSGDVLAGLIAVVILGVVVAVASWMAHRTARIGRTGSEGWGSGGAPSATTASQGRPARSPTGSRCGCARAEPSGCVSSTTAAGRCQRRDAGGRRGTGGVSGARLRGHVRQRRRGDGGRRRAGRRPRPRRAARLPDHPGGVRELDPASRPACVCLPGITRQGDLLVGCLSHREQRRAPTARMGSPARPAPGAASVGESRVAATGSRRCATVARAAFESRRVRRA